MPWSTRALWQRPPRQSSSIRRPVSTLRCVGGFAVAAGGLATSVLDAPLPLCAGRPIRGALVLVARVAARWASSAGIL
jgi:hypothetical protein